MGRFNTLKFSESGVRGIVGEGLTPRLVAELGAAFGLYRGGGRVVVGRDTRATGAMFEEALSAGLLSAGCQVVKLGIVPTPTVQFTVSRIGASGGIAITASHNPAQWNALKFIGGDGMFLDPAEASELFDLYSQGNPPCRVEKDLRDVRTLPGAFAAHEERIFSVIDAEGVRCRRFRVAVDCANGVGALYSAEFLRHLGCEVFPIHDEADGQFRRPPEPLPENLEALCRVVRENHCDIGFGQDPDGDRLTVVTDRGEALNPHYTVALAVEQVLDGGDPGPVVVNIQTSRLVEAIAASYHCGLVISKVGEINVVEKMIETDSMIGGEGNCGGVIYRRVHSGRDSFTAMALILERLAFSERPLSGIVAEFPAQYNLSARFPVPPIAARNVLDHFRRKYADRSPLTFDGLRFDLETGRVLMRSSNTEPIFRLNVESTERFAAEALLERFSAEIREELTNGGRIVTEAKFYLFDMDHTLIQADCDVTWKQFAVAHGLAPETALVEADRFFDDYNAGKLDIEAFHEFQFREFAGNTVERMAGLAELHFREFIADRLYPEAVKLIDELRAAGLPVGILTSTNSVIATPVARAFGIDLVLGTRLELRDGRYTGRISGVYGVGPGKVEIAAAELKQRGFTLAELAYYGDSINDRYILEACGFPYTVNPSASLRVLAERQHWPILSWKLEAVK